MLCVLLPKGQRKLVFFKQMLKGQEIGWLFRAASVSSAHPGAWGQGRGWGHSVGFRGTVSLGWDLLWAEGV